MKPFKNTAGLEQFRQHLEGKVVHRECPLCDANDWVLDGPAAISVLNEATENKPGSIGPGIFPTTFMICNNCYFCYPFMWGAIKGGADAGK